MAGHHGILHVPAFVDRRGYASLFLCVLAEQSAILLPSIPLLGGAEAWEKLARP